MNANKSEFSSVQFASIRVHSRFFEFVMAHRQACWTVWLLALVCCVPVSSRSDDIPRLPGKPYDYESVKIPAHVDQDELGSLDTTPKDNPITNACATVESCFMTDSFRETTRRRARPVTNRSPGSATRGGSAADLRGNAPAGIRWVWRI